MADELGSAVLRITVDDSAARQSLQSLRQEIQRSTRAGGVGGGRAQGGARENILTLERAQNRRFQIAQRIERLEERGANVSRLRARLGDATTAQAQRQFGTFRQITNELQRQVKLSEARAAREDRIAQALARQARVGGPRESILGRRGLTGSPADLAFLARQGGPRSPIGGALTIPDSPRFLEAARRAGEAQARAFQAEIGRAARAGGARSPIGGAVDIPGSPAFLEAQRRFAAQELSRAAAIGGPRSPIGGTPLLAGSPAAIRAEERLAQARQRATQAAEKAAQAEGRRIGRLNVSPVRGGAAFPGSPDFLKSIFPAFPTAAVRQQFEEGLRIGALNASPVRGGTAFPGSPIFLQAQAKAARERFDEERKLAQELRQQRLTARKQRLETLGRRGGQVVNVAGSTAIGGGFPLLFGQGVGAAAGGAIGGLVGSGFGGAGGFAGSIIGTAIGALGDQFGLLAKAVENPVENIKQLTETSALSGKGIEQLATVLAELGRTAEAEALIREDLSRRVDAQSFISVAAANDAYARSIGDVQQRIGALLAGPALNFANWLANLGSRLSGLPLGATGPTQRSALALRGQGAAAGIGGTALAGLGVASLLFPLTAPAAIPLIAGGAGLATVGATQIGGAEFQQQQLAAAKAIEPQLNKIQAIEERRTDVQRRALDANLKGNKSKERELRLESTLLELDKQRQQAIATFISTPGDDPDGRQARALKAQLDAIKLRGDAAKQEFEREERARQANIRLTREQTDIAVSGIDQQIQAAKQLGNVEIGAAKQALRLRQGIEQNIGNALRNFQSLGAGIDAARSIGDADTVRNLVQQQRTAAKELELALVNGATQLRDAAKLAKENIETAQLRLSDIQRDPQGLNQFLFPEEVSDRRRQALINLGPQLDEAIKNASRILGVSSERFLPLRGILQSAVEGRGVSDAGFRRVSDFISSSRTETNAIRDVRSAEQALAAINGELTGATNNLASQIAGLVQKNWNVLVNVNGNSAQLLGDVNGALV